MQRLAGSGEKSQKYELPSTGPFASNGIILTRLDGRYLCRSAILEWKCLKSKMADNLKKETVEI